MSKRFVYITVLSLSIYTLLCTACQPKSGGNKQSEILRQQYDSLILGRWQAQEINSGVVCSVFFMPRGRLSLYFHRPDGYNRQRPGEWNIQGDSLYLQEQTGPSTLFIEHLDDTLMVLRTIDSVPVFFERHK